MTLRQNRTTPGSQQATPTTRPRLRLKPKAPATGYVDGAWWPRSDDLGTELPDLLAVLSVRLGLMQRVLFNLGDWGKEQTEFELGCEPVGLAGSTGQPVDTIQV